METASTPCKVHQCSKCPGDTEYYCVSCQCDLCPQCKENHVKDLQTIDHDVVSHRNKLNYIPTQEICVRHPGHVYTKYCEPCQVPVCYDCRKHRNHQQLVITTSYNTKQQQHRGTIHTIRSEALFYRPVLLPQIKTDFKICHTQFSLYQSQMLTKAQTLKHLIDYIQKDFMCNVFCDFDFKHRCLKQKKEMVIYIVSLQRYIHIYEQRRVIRPLQFLSSIKTALPQIHPTLHTSQLSMTESLNKEDVMESLSAIQITERGNRRVGNQCLLKLTSAPEFHQSLTLTGVDRCLHISCVTSDRVWVSDHRKNLILTDTKGVPLHRVEDSCRGLYRGLHTVNSESELIYIDRNYNINKLSKDMKTTTTFIERTYSTWEPQCVYWSPSTGDLLVGMIREISDGSDNSDDTDDTELIWTGNVTRYNQSGQLTQTIQHDNTGRRLYNQPNYITENNNGDVVVSDYWSGVVVTERGGRHRFSYTGPPSGLGLVPCGICTDALSNILVCDYTTNTVQMLDKDGQFLSHLLTKSQEMGVPRSLRYDVNTHRLWVGSRYNNKVCVYRYITRQDALTDQSRMMESQSGIPTPGTEKPQQGNQCLLKLMSPPEILHSLTVTGVNGCYHISCVTSDQVWVSDTFNLTLTDTTGVRLHRVKDSRSFLSGLHTVNSESELIYIDSKDNINKLSKDMKTTTTFIETTNPTWRPRCVYWSPSTGDLLVGMCYIHTETGKVTRYNQSGQLTQTIQHDNTGRRLYNQPNYITENNNGDVVVSDYWSGVVVTERGGRHRFSYTGPPSGSGLKPSGICTDALSHIMVCENHYIIQTVQMLDKDGQFLSHLLTKSQEMGEPHSLSYDVNTHRLWVGSRDNNKVCVYRYITRQDALTDESCIMESLSGIPTPGTEKPQQGNQRMLKLLSSPELLHSLTVIGVSRCLHMSCLTSDSVWVSDHRNNLILTDTTGVPLHRVEDSCSDLYGGLHTVNSESELIYIDRNYNIKKLSKDMKTTTTFIEKTDFTWRPRCVYWSPYTGDLLVGMRYIHTETGKVARYNQSGQLTHTIQHANTGRGLYRKPNYITENNGDVVVSDYIDSGSGAVVVTERGGRHRFSYTGPLGSGLDPRGICTDALSHILVCDDITDTVQMLDKDGQFLSHLLTESQEMGVPWGLGYDVNTHRLWIGSEDNNKVCVYRYITRQDALTDQSRVMESVSGIPTPGTEKPQQGNQCLLKLMSPPELLHSLTLTGVYRCYHISCVTSDRVWVSDHRNNLMLTDTTGVPLHRVEDSCSGRGLHTVNSESELIYIDRNDNINKLSKDMKTTTTFIERTDYTWRPRCVYWSPSTGDLLVAMYYLRANTGKVTRYNQSGQLTQTIQYHNTGRGLYRQPHYITENNNGDVVVSDCINYESGTVVVTEPGGRHRFSYTGHPSGSGLKPCGICTDPLSHILVCDDTTKTVQMLDRDGQFLSHLLTKSQEMGEPLSLSYDVNTHRLWVGSGSWCDNNKVVIYRYITRQDALTDEHRPRPDGEAMFSSTSAIEWR
ncbi:uncharacterized protein [Magallana gigas]|uniref:uncharacterized protein n=1 Tax=Magallana gigas TaxID=29159 RepID=UPI00333FD3CB